jgi:hypothetical protein
MQSHSKRVLRKRQNKSLIFQVPVGLPLAYIGNVSRTKLRKGEMSLRGVFD